MVVVVIELGCRKSISTVIFYQIVTSLEVVWLDGLPLVLE
jgi:hypothetical protein